MKKLLIITEEPFGYQTDFYNWCFYLRDEYEITYLCFEVPNLQKIEIEGVLVVEVESASNIVSRELKYLKTLHNLVSSNHYHNIIVTNNTRSNLVKFRLINKRVIHDIRTVAVQENLWKRVVYNIYWFLSTRLYTHNSIITPSIAVFYKIPFEKYTVLPLGANVISTVNKKFDDLHLLYIGVIRPGFEESIRGFAEYVKIKPKSTYTIIGYKDYSKQNTIEILLNTIDELKQNDNVFFLGRKSHEEAKEYFNKCNVGVSFIPMLPQFDNQPPTKNYEYMLSGMVCIATATSANIKHINESNGVIINDNAASFAQGLLEIDSKRHTYRSEIIRLSQMQFKWETIVNEVLKPILKRFEN